MTNLTGSHIFRSWPGIQLTLIVLSEVKVDWPTFTSNSPKNCFTGFQIKYLFLQKVLQIFKSFIQEVKNWCFVIFSSKIWHRRDPADPTPSACFYCCYRPPRAEEFPPGCGPQPGVLPVNIPVSFWPQTPQGAGEWQVLSWARTS
jgi:hypothetical protein